MGGVQESFDESGDYQQQQELRRLAQALSPQRQRAGLRDEFCHLSAASGPHRPEGTGALLAQRPHLHR
ncbi:hypothetical protein AERO8C_70385 [Aeromonas veronii]|uniref:Uncharacterized protein n=1 Tax=Aeromonas veronii TaxID=654 RepID=A0A653LCN2_AERVE|nr:hypothetical protein AERO8C_70385 [Aeromonas veronii]